MGTDTSTPPTMECLAVLGGDGVAVEALVAELLAALKVYDDRAGASSSPKDHDHGPAHDTFSWEGPVARCLLLFKRPCMHSLDEFRGDIQSRELLSLNGNRDLERLGVDEIRGMDLEREEPAAPVARGVGVQFADERLGLDGVAPLRAFKFVLSTGDVWAVLVVGEHLC